ncbi:MAG: IclR family transcriptional regulator [Oscillospiraceae bacterium]|nr:IclR family transcriptional regulator [Oscillospiraceae bacterium]
MGNGDSKNVKSIIKAAAIIDALADSDEPLALSAISRELGMAKSTLHGLISTLVDVGYVAQDVETGYYFLGFKLFEIGSTVSRKWNERKIAYPFMQKLAEKTGETIHLAVLDDGEVLYILKQESSDSIRIVTDMGIKLPAHCTGLGKVLLSGLQPYDFKKFIRRRSLDKYTDTTITNMERLKEELDRIRAQGYAIDEQEYVEGLRCVAVPIHNHRGDVTCALSVAGPVARMRGQVFEKKKQDVLEAAHEISRQMGYQGG